MFNYCSEPWDLCHRFCLYINSQLKYCNTFINRTLYLQLSKALRAMVLIFNDVDIKKIRLKVLAVY